MKTFQSFLYPKPIRYICYISQIGQLLFFVVLFVYEKNTLMLVLMLDYSGNVKDTAVCTAHLWHDVRSAGYDYEAL